MAQEFENLLETMAAKTAIVFNTDVLALKKWYLRGELSNARAGCIWMLYRNGFSFPELANFFCIEKSAAGKAAKRFAAQNNLEIYNEFISEDIRQNVIQTRFKFPRKDIPSTKEFRFRKLEAKVNKIIQFINTTQNDKFKNIETEMKKMKQEFRFFMLTGG